eukprot:151559_1
MPKTPKTPKAPKTNNNSAMAITRLQRRVRQLQVEKLMMAETTEEMKIPLMVSEKSTIFPKAIDITKMRLLKTNKPNVPIDKSTKEKCPPNTEPQESKIAPVDKTHCHVDDCPAEQVMGTGSMTMISSQHISNLEKHQKLLNNPNTLSMDLATNLLRSQSLREESADKSPAFKLHTSLLWSMYLGQQQETEKLLANPDLQVNAVYKATPKATTFHKQANGETLLITAVRNNNLMTVNLILDHTQIDINISCSHGTALAVAAFHGHTKIMHMLLDYDQVNVNVVDASGRTPLITAVELHRPIITSILVQDRDIDVNMKCDAKGGAQQTTALTTAARKGYSAIVLELLRHEDIDISIVDGSRYSALCYAATRGDLDMVRVLVELQPDHNFDYSAALPLAACCGHYDIMCYLLDNTYINVNSVHTVFR